MDNMPGSIVLSFSSMVLYIVNFFGATIFTDPNIVNEIVLLIIIADNVFMMAFP